MNKDLYLLIGGAQPVDTHPMFSDATGDIDLLLEPHLWEEVEHRILPGSPDGDEEGDATSSFARFYDRRETLR